jgi:hypothetical protein
MERRNVGGLLRELVRADLAALGVNARVHPRGDILEAAGKEYLPTSRDSGESLGLIEVDGGPIRWVNILQYHYGGGLHHTGTAYLNVYLIPHPNPQQKEPLKIVSRPVRRPRLLGPVTGVRWESKPDSDLVPLLNTDSWLNDSITKLKEQLIIYPELGYWVIKPKHPYTEAWSPRRSYFLGRQTSRDQWECYTAIARYLMKAR